MSKYEHWLKGKSTWRSRLRYWIGGKLERIGRQLKWELVVGIDYDENGCRIKRQPMIENPELKIGAKS